MFVSFKHAYEFKNRVVYLQIWFKKREATDYSCPRQMAAFSGTGLLVMIRHRTYCVFYSLGIREKRQLYGYISPGKGKPVTRTSLVRYCFCNVVLWTISIISTYSYKESKKIMKMLPAFLLCISHENMFLFKLFELWHWYTSVYFNFRHEFIIVFK